MTILQLQPSESDGTEVLGQRIHALMYGRFRSYSALAREIGSSPSELSKKLSGQRLWYYRDIKAVANALGTTVGYLTGETDNPEPLKRSDPASVETGSGFVAGTGFEPATSGL
ncbi:transcriptional regulator with XRE-family HTH domain [Aurantimicrobium minutum]|nr:transcriptional regulator with XRE-family HTH domain [Aurantimicrobium minutum]